MTNQCNQWLIDVIDDQNFCGPSISHRSLIDHRQESMTYRLISYRLPFDYSLISLMSLMSSINYAWVYWSPSQRHGLKSCKAQLKQSCFTLTLHSFPLFPVFLIGPINTLVFDTLHQSQRSLPHWCYLSRQISEEPLIAYLARTSASGIMIVFLFKQPRGDSDFYVTEGTSRLADSHNLALRDEGLLHLSKWNRREGPGDEVEDKKGVFFSHSTLKRLCSKVRDVELKFESFLFL